MSSTSGVDEDREREWSSPNKDACSSSASVGFRGLSLGRRKWSRWVGVGMNGACLCEKFVVDHRWVERMCVGFRLCRYWSLHAHQHPGIYTHSYVSNYHDKKLNIEDKKCRHPFSLSCESQSDSVIRSLPIRRKIAGSGNERDEGSKVRKCDFQSTEEVRLCFKYEVTEK